MYSRVTVQILAFIILTLTIFLQYKIVMPVETTLTNMGGKEVASLMFLPHGMKAVLVVLCGPLALIPIFFSHLVTDLYNGMAMRDALIAGPANVLTFLVPLALINYLSNNNPFTHLSLATTSNLSLFRTVLVVAFIASLINGMIGAMRYTEVGIDFVAFRFLMGDMIGTGTLLVVLLLLKNKIIQMGKLFIAANSELKP